MKQDKQQIPEQEHPKRNEREQDRTLQALAREKSVVFALLSGEARIPMLRAEIMSDFLATRVAS